MAIRKQAKTQPKKKLREKPVRVDRPKRGHSGIGNQKASGRNAAGENTRLQKIAKMQSSFEFDETRDVNKDFLSTVDLLDYKAILYNVRHQPIALKNGYAGYIQIMEIRGKDLGTLSNKEVDRTITNFAIWNSSLTFGYTFQTTKLPTDTTEQIIESRRILEDVKKEMGEQNLSERRLAQLRERERGLMANIYYEEEVSRELYNAEFLLWLYADSIEELNQQVKAVQTSGNNDFVPFVVSAEKKKQILKQFNNQNEKV